MKFALVLTLGLVLNTSLALCSTADDINSDIGKACNDSAYKLKLNDEQKKLLKKDPTIDYTDLSYPRSILYKLVLQADENAAQIQLTLQTLNRLQGDSNNLKSQTKETDRENIGEEIHLKSLDKVKTGDDVLKFNQIVLDNEQKVENAQKSGSYNLKAKAEDANFEKDWLKICADAQNPKNTKMQPLVGSMTCKANSGELLNEAKRISDQATHDLKNATKPEKKTNKVADRASDCIKKLKNDLAEVQKVGNQASRQMDVIDRVNRQANVQPVSSQGANTQTAAQQ